MNSYTLTPHTAVSHHSHDTQYSSSASHAQPQKRKPRPRDASLRESIAYYTDDQGYWRGCVNTSGYPSIKWQGRIRLVHRLVLELAGHDIQGKYVLHIDDNPLNINLSNLRIGTHADNMADMVAKGRSHSLRPRIKGAEAADIMQMEALGIPVLQIAKQFGRSYGKLLAFISRTKAKQVLRDSQGNAQASLCFPESLAQA